jgi:hypothetical protein
VKFLFKIFIVVVVAQLVEVALLYLQARAGRKLPVKIRLIPNFDIGEEA